MDFWLYSEILMLHITDEGESVFSNIHDKGNINVENKFKRLL